MSSRWVLTALDVDSAGGVLPPQRVLRHTRVIPRILQPGAVDQDSGVFAVGENTRQLSQGNRSRDQAAWKRNNTVAPWRRPSRRSDLDALAHVECGGWFHYNANANEKRCSRLLV